MTDPKSTTYPPGTVARATVRGLPDIRIMRCDDKLLPASCWMASSGAGGTRYLTEGEVADVRVLPVLDLPESDLREFVTDAKDYTEGFVTRRIGEIVEAALPKPDPTAKSVIDNHLKFYGKTSTAEGILLRLSEAGFSVTRTDEAGA